MTDKLVKLSDVEALIKEKINSEGYCPACMYERGFGLQYCELHTPLQELISSLSSLPTIELPTN